MTVQAFCLSILTVALATVSHGSEQRHHETRRSVGISPFSVPPDREYPHEMAVLISPPWEQKGEWRLRAPETLGSNRGLLFIDHHREDMIPVTLPTHPLTWKNSPQGGLEYDCELEMGIVMGVRISPGQQCVDIRSFPGSKLFIY